MEGTAQCVAAWCCKSDWGQLGGWSSALGNVTWHAWHERNCISLCTARAVLILGGSIPTPITFLFVDQISPNFFLLNVGGIVVDQVCFRFLISRSTLEIFAVKVQSCLKSRQIFWVFLPFQIFEVQDPIKFVPKLSCMPRDTSRAKVWWGYMPWPQSYRRGYADF